MTSTGKRVRTIFAATLSILFIPPISIKALGNTDSEQSGAAAVVFQGDTLFSLYSSIGPFSAGERAQAVSERLNKLVGNFSSIIDTFYVNDNETSSDIYLADFMVASVTDKDAAVSGFSRGDLARVYATEISKALKDQVSRRSFNSILVGVLAALGITILFLVILFGTRKLVVISQFKIMEWQGTHIKPIKIQNFELLSAAKIISALASMVKFVWATLMLIIFYLYLSLVFSLFPWTTGFAYKLLEYVSTPLTTAIRAFISYIPSFFFILVIVALTKLFLKLIRLIFGEIGKGNITIPGFYQEWADPTYKIVRFLAVAFSVVIAFPYLPGSNQPAFKGISIFLGVLFSLGSASAISNIIAGVVLTYMRPFKVGDHVKIADTMGNITEKTLLTTRIRTTKNVEISIPNSLVLGSHIINYNPSESARNLIIPTTVTIGYDVPWRKVHELLVAAASATSHVQKEPAPFVLQTALDDSYVRYELNAYTDRPNLMANIYSELHQNIQDKFNEAGVEIMSPSYGAIRDGNKTAIPEQYLPGNYSAPGFKFQAVDKNDNLKIPPA